MKEENIICFAKHEPPKQAWFIGVGPIIINGKEIGYCDGEKITFHNKVIIENPKIDLKSKEQQ